LPAGKRTFGIIEFDRDINLENLGQGLGFAGDAFAASALAPFESRNALGNFRACRCPKNIALAT
jgi:hypothetical protein